MKALKSLPNLTVTENEKLTEGTVTSSGRNYEATDEVIALFGLSEPKSEVYQGCLREMIEDVREAILDPTHTLAVSLETGRRAIETAIAAQNQARTE